MSDQALQPAGGGQIAGYGNLAPSFGAGLPPSLQILLDDGLYNRVKQLSAVMANAQGMTPAHLIGKPEACFAIINIALDNRLSPHFVAGHTYQTPNGQIGYDGALVQAILEQSNKFVGAPEFQHVGDWHKIMGKPPQIKTSQKGREFVAPSWTPAEAAAAGVGVIVRWQVRGEPKPRVWPAEDEPFLLTQCFPLNSPLWATDPKTQICYLAIRRFARVTSPGILGAAAFSDEQMLDAAERARDVTPAREPRREDFTAASTAGTTEVEPDEEGMIQDQPETRPKFTLINLDGEYRDFPTDAGAAEALYLILTEAGKQGTQRIDGAWQDNLDTVETLGSYKDRVTADYMDLRSEAELRERREQRRQEASGSQDPRLGRLRGLRRAAGLDDGHETPDAMALDAGFTQAEIDKRRAATTQAQAREAPIPTQDTRRTEDAPSAPAAAGRPRMSRSADLAPGEDPGITENIEQPSQQPIAAHAAERSEPADHASDGPARSVESSAETAGRSSLFIPVPVNRAGKEDFRGWSMALFQPKARKVTSSNEFAQLLGDNEETLQKCRQGGLAKDDLRDLEFTISSVWRQHPAAE